MASDGGGGGEGSVASDPDFAAVCSFLKVFGTLYGLEAPSISELQLFLEDTQEVPEVLKELQLKLLRRAVKWLKPESWERSLVKFCHQHTLHKEAWELERFTYKKSSAKVKLAILKVLLEYQFTCHTKFKTSVNTLRSSELRLEPVGRDRAGRVYWLQTDQEANLRLYREDQDEETWTLIARDRDGLVKVINQLKSGEDITTADDSLLNEDSNSLETISQEQKPAQEDESNEEFLSPDSESDNGSDSGKVNDNDGKQSTSDSEKVEHKKEENNQNISNNSISNISLDDKKLNSGNLEHDNSFENQVFTENNGSPNSNAKEDSKVDEEDSTKDIEKSVTEINDLKDNIKKDTSPVPKPDEDIEELENSIGPEIEEPVMMVTGEGNGADCESGDVETWDEITEPVMYFWGQGDGFECDTGNPGESSVTCDSNISNDSTAKSEDKIEETSINKCEDTANNGVVTSDSDSNKIVEKIKGDSHHTVSKRLLQDNSQSSDIKAVESTPKKTMHMEC